MGQQKVFRLYYNIEHAQSGQFFHDLLVYSTANVELPMQPANQPVPNFSRRAAQIACRQATILTVSATQPITLR